MAALKDLLTYLLINYPHQDHLSNARVTKMVYLTDWRHALKQGRQVTDISWEFNHHGPFVWDVKDTIVRNSDLFRIRKTQNAFGGDKTQFLCKGGRYKPELDPLEREAADHIIRVTKNMSWGDFIDVVYSTYPIVTSDRYSHLDLPTLADRYKKSPIYGVASEEATV